MQRQSCLVFALLTLVSCSGDGSSNDGGSSDGAVTDQAGSDVSTACTPPLSQASFCEATFTDQVAANPCDDPTNPITTRTCGAYKVWENLFIGSQTCVYNAAGTMLMGARTCDTTIDYCANNCVVYGIAESAYATCGADSPACP